MEMGQERKGRGTASTTYGFSVPVCVTLCVCVCVTLCHGHSRSCHGHLGAKSELMEHPPAREFVISCATGDGTFGWSNSVSLHLMKKRVLLLMLNCAGCHVGFRCYH